MGIVEAGGVARPVPGLRRRDVTLFKRLHEDAVIPTKAHNTDAGFDLYAFHEATIHPGEQVIIKTGVAVAVPSYAVGLVCPRSGLAAKHGITITNAPGIIDSGYRGELMVILQNTKSTAFEVSPGDRIAQLVVVPFLGLSTEVHELPEADRGDNGFGSSGT